MENHKMEDTKLKLTFGDFAPGEPILVGAVDGAFGFLMSGS